MALIRLLVACRHQHSGTAAVIPALCYQHGWRVPSAPVVGIQAAVAQVANHAWTYGAAKFCLQDKVSRDSSTSRQRLLPHGAGGEQWLLAAALTNAVALMTTPSIIIAPDI